MKVLTAMLLLGPLAGFAWMWSQCYLAQMAASRLREENLVLKQEIEYATRLNRELSAKTSHQIHAGLNLREPLGPMFDTEPTRDSGTALSARR